MARNVTWPFALRADILHHRSQILGEPVGICAHRPLERRTASTGPPQCRGTIGIAEFHTAGLHDRQRLLRPPRDRLTFLLGYERHDADSQIIRLRHVHRQETHTAVAAIQRLDHPFRVIKRQFGHVKTRYRGLAKNRAQLFTLFALGNLFLVRRKLLA